MKISITLLGLVTLCNCFIGCKGQPVFGENLLQVNKTILLPGIKGRIDHMDINLADQVIYVAALGNNTVETIDLRNSKIIHSIKNLDEPQGVCYIARNHEIFVANGGSGDCYFYNAISFEKVATVALGADADDVRYDEATGKIYVGYGKGGIAIIDAGTHQQTGNVNLPGHPESLQVDKKLHWLYVNVPDAGMVAVIDLTAVKLIKTWTRSSPKANFPMAIDTIQHRLFIGYRHPATLIVMDGKTGREIASDTMAGDADDLYYDSGTARVLVSGGDGNINLFQQEGEKGYKQVANIATSSGARTSLFVPDLKLFILAVRAVSGNPAKLMVYNIR